MPVHLSILALADAFGADMDRYIGVSEKADGVHCIGAVGYSYVVS